MKKQSKPPQFSESIGAFCRMMEDAQKDYAWNYSEVNRMDRLTQDYLHKLIVSIASGVGCCLAVTLSNRFSKDRTYVNVILSDDKEAMKEFRDFLAENHITNVATDSYTLDWSRKSISITAYAQTKVQSRLIDEYIERSLLKCKRVIRKN